MSEEIKKPNSNRTVTVGDAMQAGLPNTDGERASETDSRLFGEFAVAAMGRINTEPLPQVLYHYTTAEGLLGIVGGDTLRFSDSKFMNDGSEMAWGMRVLQEYLKERFASAPEKQQQFWQSVLGEVERKSEPFRHVIFCMSRQSNLLNQWRDYGRDVVPYSIGLETSYFLSSPIGSFDAFVTPLVYKWNVQRDAVDFVVSSISEAMNDQWYRPDDRLAGASFDAASQLGWLISQFKNSAFESEQEVRLQLTHYKLRTDHGAKPLFRASMLGLVPYYEWKPSSGRLPVKQIFVGPSPHSASSHEALRIFLAEQNLDGVYSDCSTIPIRR